MLPKSYLPKQPRHYKVTSSHLCQSGGRGRVWDRSGSRYRLWWFVHFTFFYGSALGWRCVASLSVEEIKKKKKKLIKRQWNETALNYLISTERDKCSHTG